MDFREYAAKEAHELTDRLAKAAAAAAQRAADDSARQIDVVTKNLAAKTHEADELAATLKNLQGQGDALRRDLKAQKERAESLEAQLARVQDALKKAEAQRAKFEASNAIAEEGHAQESRARTTIEAELKEVRRALDATMAESERLSTEIEAHAAEKAALTEKLAAAQNLAHAAEAKRQTITTLFKAGTVRVESLEKAQAEAERAVAEARAEVERARQAVVGSDALLGRVLEAFEGIAAPTTIADLLVALTDALAGEFARVALFRVRGNKLEGAHQVGFDLNTDIAKVVIPLAMDSLLARAVASGCIESIEPGVAADVSRAPFGGAPTCALALPVVVNGETFGILYADNGAEPDEQETVAAQAWKGRLAELLLRHAVALLMRLTAELRTFAELREHATRLLNHVAEMYASDVDTGTQGADLQARLLENLDCARRLYAQRISIEGPGAAGLLEDQLATLLDERASTPFGRDLAAVAGGTAARAAEAS